MTESFPEAEVSAATHSMTLCNRKPPSIRILSSHKRHPLIDSLENHIVPSPSTLPSIDAHLTSHDRRNGKFINECVTGSPLSQGKQSANAASRNEDFTTWGDGMSRENSSSIPPSHLD
ncbi:hypothetical protein CYMTET_20715 [Cymbomonas tetramitiformis]|uniref:Uncharacterized protein n=1 Tax=Cymbomonas tetramitiformis TaxID=36881 RepID=A0AAE0G3H8_9CHLO|nr:hypothetical protein CYMTET_20715 [Cymbomonas tetramitiformis]